MIPQTDLSWQEESWQSAWQNAITDPLELCRLLDVDPLMAGVSDEAARHFSLRVPRYFTTLMEHGNARDPLLLQVLSSRDEMVEAPGYSDDPLAETLANPLPGLIRKYHNRVLLTVSGACAVHCRYCFRRHFDYQANNPGNPGWSAVIDYLRQHPEIDEVIYSGGDPLSATDRQLHQLTQLIRAIPSVVRLRVHTRFPVVIPQRITDECLEWLGLFENPLVVLHINHAQEVGSDLTKAVGKLRQAGVLVLNQSVLLKGINDSPEAQEALHLRCFSAGILPYYLHLLDPVRGAAHFDVDGNAARELLAHLGTKLPGYLVPHLVREEPGKPGKTRLA
jgi:EF-P beta-lysylation protein EpmB